MTRVSDDVVEELVSGDTLRGVRDDELSDLRLHVAIVASLPPNVLHTAETVKSLVDLIDGAVVIGGCPESPRPDFAPHLDRFVDLVGSQIAAIC